MPRPLPAFGRACRCLVFPLTALAMQQVAAAPVTVDLSRTSTWSGGYNGRMTVKNTGTQPLTNWTLAFTTQDKLTFWNQTATVSGTTWTVKPASWNATIPAGGSVNVDFGATTTSATGWDPWSTATFNGQAVVVNNGTTPVVAITVTPTTATLAPSATFTFKAAVTGSTNTTVTWKAAKGTITAAGLYTAPAAEGTDTVTVTSAADPTKTATATVTVQKAQVVAVTVDPTSATLAPSATFTFKAAVTGSPNTAVTWKAAKGTITAAGLYTAPATEGPDTVTATSAADPTKTATATVTVQKAQVVAVTVDPTTATLAPGATFTFKAAVTGSTNTAVTWKAAKGTITAAGLYTAPAAEGTDTVTATSAADPTKTATATITVKKADTAAAALTFRRKSGYAGGYQGELTLANGTAQPLSGWTLTFDSADTLALNSGNGSVSAGIWTVTPATWTPAIPAGGTWVCGFGGTYTTSDWNPPTQAKLNGAVIPITVVDDMPSPDGNAIVATFPELETAARPQNLLTLANGTVRLKMVPAGGMTGPFTVTTSHPRLIDVSLADGGATLVVTSKSPAGGRAALRITDTATGKARVFGLRIKDSAGATPGFPDYVSVGVCSEDAANDLAMFRNFGSGDLNRRADNRYIYLNGGPTGPASWWNWTSVPGDRARTYIRYSQRYGLIPTFVWYNIPDATENYETDLAHIQDVTYMQGYFDLLKRTLALFNQESKDELIMMVMEPDFIGYMMQKSGKQPSQITAQVMNPLKNAGLLTGADPTFPDTLEGLVKAINHVVSRDCPQVKFGWQINVWSSPDGLPNGVKTLIKSTDIGWDTGRAFIQQQAQKVAQYYKDSGITYKAHFISFDKYGYDAAGATPGCASDPAPSPWFWNSDHWNNYLFYVKQLRDVTQLPVALWQLPVGRINSSLAKNPTKADGLFADLTNTTNRYEDSTATFFFGDSFKPGAGPRAVHFGKNLALDPALKVNGDTLVWGPHFQAAKEAGVFNIMFGDGIGDSTRARPKTDSEPTDGWWLMTAIQRYLANPVPLK